MELLSVAWQMLFSEFLNNDGDWSEWSPWTSCSTPCGGGIHYRVRTCDNPRPTGSGLDCLGESRLERACNTHLCHNLEGWDEWTVWSECDGKGYQYRKRQCQLSEAGSESCQGTDRQQRMCLDDFNDEDNEILPMAVHSASAIKVGHLVAACFVCFIVGALSVGSLVYYITVKRRHSHLMRGNKHFINRPSSPNLYTPPKDCLSKNNYSSGTLTKNKGIPLTKESTLKRNGHKAQLSSEMFE